LPGKAHEAAQSTSINFSESQRGAQRSGRPHLLNRKENRKTWQGQTRPAMKGKEQKGSQCIQEASYLFCSKYPKIKGEHPILFIGDDAKKLKKTHTLVQMTSSLL
jgi:hypothetical protein